jgi:signal peptide peptidase SppA
LLSIYQQALVRKAETGSARLDRDELLALRERGEFAELHLRPTPFHRDAVSFGPSEPLENARYTRVYPGGVAVIDVEGPIYRHASDASSGAVSTSRIARDLMLALKAENVRSILFVIDSPGGEATGLDELSAKIFEARNKKPIEAHIEGLGASAAYYIASATSRITASPMALVGSIGVVIGVPLPKRETKSGHMVHDDGHGGEYVEIVSAQSPKKRVNAGTDEGMAYYQTIVNETADVFVRDVARFRNLSADDVPKQYGDGGVSVARTALALGLIDAVGSFESVLNRMASAYYQPQTQTTTTSGEGSEAHQGGEEVSLLDRLLGADKTQAKDEGGKAGGPLPIDAVLADLHERRAGLEQQLEPKALLFVQELLGQKKPIHAIQNHVAYEMLTALVDDALLGGTVLLPKLEGSTYAEAEGTREELVRAKYAAMPMQTLAGERVASVRGGSVKARVLNESDPEKVTNPEPKGRAAADGETHSDDDLLAMSTDGQRAIENRNGGNGTSAATR